MLLDELYRQQAAKDRLEDDFFLIFRYLQNELEAERAQLYEEVDSMLESALLMQTWLLGDGHPSVTDTIMITVRMLMARNEHALAVPLMIRVWELRTVI